MLFPRINGYRKPSLTGYAVRALAFGGFLFTPFAGIAQESGDRSDLRSLGHCENCSFQNLDLSDRRMTAADFSGSTFRDVDFTGAELDVAIFDNARLEDVSFEAADLGGASFSGATLVNVSFDGADLTAAVFEEARLEDTALDAGLLCFTQMPNEMTNSTECE